MIKYRAEAIAVCIFEFNEENYKKIGREFWREKGIEQGKDCLRLLIQKMAEAGEEDLLVRLTDEAFLEQMCEKYQI